MAKQANKTKIDEAIDKEMRDGGYNEVGGDVEKWEDWIGEKVKGRFLRIRPARNEDSSPVLVLDTEEGLRQFWCPTVLEDRLEGIEAGSELFIVCLGKIYPSKKKGYSNAWGFKVGIK